MDKYIQENQNKLLEITQEFLKESGNSFKKVNLDNSLQYHLGLGSLERLELFLKIEKSFHIQISDRAMSEANTLREIAALINAKPSSKQEHFHTFSKEEDYELPPDNAETLLDILFFYAEKHPNKKHVFFQNEYSEEIITYKDLLENALKVASSLLELGISSGEKVGIMIPNHPAFLATFFGILLTKSIPVPLYPLIRKDMYESLAMQEAIILRKAQVTVLITYFDLMPFNKKIHSLVPSLKHCVSFNHFIKKAKEKLIVPEKSDDAALIQYLSCRTEEAQGITLTHQRLLNTIRNYGNKLHITKKDRVVSWFPLYLNLGLIGMWLTSFYFGIPIVLMSPYAFLRRPERWLWALHYSNATITGGDDFSYDLCAKKIKPSQIEGLDLSSLRMSIHLAELMQASTIEKFYHQFAPFKLKRNSFLAIYGLIESSTIVTMSEPNQSPQLNRIEKMPFLKEGKAIETNQTDCLTFVSAGKSVIEHAVRIVDESGHELPNCSEGIVQFKGPPDMKTNSDFYHHGWWDSKEVGYKNGDDLYLTNTSLDLKSKSPKFSSKKIGDLKKNLDRPVYDLVYSKFEPKKDLSSFKKAFFTLFKIFGKIAQIIYTIYVAIILLITGGLVFSGLWLFPKKIYAYILKYWAKCIFILAGCPIIISNKKEIYKHKRIIFIGNHASYIDTLVFMSLLPANISIVGKKELEHWPVIGKVMKHMGHLFVEREHFPKETKNNVIEICNMIEKRPVLIFPEGTFSPFPGLRPFTLGAFKVAVEKNIPLLAIATNGTRKILRGGTFLLKPCIIKVTVGTPLIPQGKDLNEIYNLKRQSRDFIAQHCGEPSLDLIIGSISED